MFGGTFDSETAEDIVCDGVSKGKADGKALHRVVIDKLIGSVVALDQKQPDAVIQHQALYCPENVLPRMAFGRLVLNCCPCLDRAHAGSGLRIGSLLWPRSQQR